MLEVVWITTAIAAAAVAASGISPGISEEEIVFHDGNSVAEQRHVPGAVRCSASISCILAGGHCVKSRKHCDGTVDPRGCKGRRCKCCIPDKTTPAPPCPDVTCKPCQCPNTAAPTTHKATTEELTTSITGPSGVKFTFINNCTQDLWMGALGQSISSPSFVYNGIAYFVANNGGWHLPIGATSQVTVPFDFTAGRFWARTGCSGTPHQNFHCETGDCGPWIECATGNVPRGGAPPVTLAEMTLNANNKDYFDISLVDGFNLPMTIHVVTYDNSEPNPNEYWCTSPECLFDINSICPPELAVNGASGTVACNSACMKFNTDEYCCRGPWGTPHTCNTDTWAINSAELFKSKCPQAYSYAYDDPTSTYTCRNTNYDIHFC